MRDNEMGTDAVGCVQVRMTPHRNELHTRSALTTYAQLASRMAVFGSATPVSKIVTAAMPMFVASVIRLALGVFVLASW
jgi:hypothetical protein